MTTTPRTAMFVGALALLLQPAAAPAADVPWEDPAVFERGQVKGRATLMPFGSVAEALANDGKASASLTEHHLAVEVGGRLRRNASEAVVSGRPDRSRRTNRGPS
jgi:hypothetical protein